jgi:aspartyl-tRNA(Asn)/glutamyl-tRNA(Gln) amidotransferase subunit A
VELDEEEIERRHARMEKLAADAAAAMEPVDVVIAPTVPVTPPRVADVADPKAYAVANKRMLSNTFLANMFELCAITLPVALDEAGLPIGLQCMAACNAEERLLSIALGFEERLGTARERLGVAPLTL